MPADPRTAGGAGGGGFGDLPPFTLVLMPRGELRALRPHDREEPVSQLALFGDVPAVAASARTEPAVNGDGSRRSKGRHASLTLGEAARIIREAVRDKSYRSTPVGLEVAHFIRWFRNEYGATVETLRDYEAILAKLAIEHAAFEPPDGTTRLRAFIDECWGDAAPRTRKKVRAVLMSFFKWAQAESSSRATRSPRSARRGCATSNASSSRPTTSSGSSPRSPSCVIASRSSCSSSWASSRASSPQSATATSTSAADASACTARAAGSATRRFRPRSSARRSLSSPSGATRPSTCSTRRSAVRRGR